MTEHIISINTFDKLCPLVKAGWKSHFVRGIGNVLSPPNPDPFPVFTDTPGKKINQAMLSMQNVCSHCVYEWHDPSEMGGMAPPGKCQPGLSETPDESSAIAINIS